MKNIVYVFTLIQIRHQLLKDESKQFLEKIVLKKFN